MPEKITQLVISAVHNSRQNLLTKIASSIAEQQGSFIPVEEVEGSPISTSRGASLQAVVAMLQQKQNEHGSLPLVTIMADFNLGYSGLNVSPLHKLVENIENLPAAECKEADGSVSIKKYKFVKSAEELTRVDTTADIPVRIYTTGGGGTDVSPQLELLNIDRDKARKQFSFEGKDIIGFCGSMRSVSGTPRTPSVNSRRLDPSSPSPSPVFGSSAQALMTLTRASSAASTDSIMSSSSLGALRTTSSSSFSESASPTSPIMLGKIELAAMEPLNLLIPEKGNAFDDLNLLLKALPPASPNTSPKRSPKRPSPIKTSLGEDKQAADNVTRALFK